MQKNGSGTHENRLDSLKERARNLVDAGGERAGQLKSRAIDVKDQFVDSGGEVLRKTSSLIKEHPLIAIGIAFGIGYMTVRLLRK